MITHNIIYYAVALCKPLLQSSQPAAAKQFANCCKAVCQLLRSSLPTAAKQSANCCEAIVPMLHDILQAFAARLQIWHQHLQLPYIEEEPWLKRDTTIHCFLCWLQSIASCAAKHSVLLVLRSTVCRIELQHVVKYWLISNMTCQQNDHIHGAARHQS